jgi:hypothetical protein
MQCRHRDASKFGECLSRGRAVAAVKTTPAELRASAYAQRADVDVDLGVRRRESQVGLSLGVTRGSCSASLKSLSLSGCQTLRQHVVCSSQLQAATAAALWTAAFVFACRAAINNRCSSSLRRPHTVFGDRPGASGSGVLRHTRYPQNQKGCAGTISAVRQDPITPAPPVQIGREAWFGLPSPANASYLRTLHSPSPGDTANTMSYS